MPNAGLDEAQAEIKIAGTNINNLRKANDTTLMAESEEKLKSLLMKVKEESKNLAESSTFKKLRSSGHITSWGRNGKRQTLFSWDSKSLRTVAEAMKLKDAYSLKGKL